MILIAPDSFKGTYSSLQVGKAIQEGINLVDESIETMLLPMSDGGDGALEVINYYLDVHIMSCVTVDPIGKAINTNWLKADNCAYIEVAQASGLHLLNELAPLKASSYGTGLQIKSAIKNGCNEIYLTLGGTATSDGGSGILHALGVVFYDSKGNKVIPNGGNLRNIVEIDTSVAQYFRNVKFVLATDVSNPLLGGNGAVYSYSKQKGAYEEDMVILEDGLNNYSNLLKKITDNDVSHLSGCGSAGGIPLSLLSLFDCRMESGFKLMKIISNIEQLIERADLVITGEGKIDEQTRHGKLPYQIQQLSNKYGKEVVYYCGVSDVDVTNIYAIKQKDNAPKGTLSDLTKLVSKTIKSFL